MKTKITPGQIDKIYREKSLPKELSPRSSVKDKSKEKDDLPNGLNQIKDAKRIKKRYRHFEVRLNPEIKQQEFEKIKNTAQVLSKEQICDKHNCSMKMLEDKVKENQENLMTTRMSALLHLEKKKKQSLFKWEIEREAHQVRLKEEKMIRKRQLQEYRRQWESMNRISQQRRKEQQNLRHSINKQKVQMIRTSRKMNQVQEQKIVKQRERQSFLHKRFKQQNQRRLQEARRQLQFDTAKQKKEMMRSFSKRKKQK